MWGIKENNWTKVYHFWKAWLWAKRDCL